MSSPKTKHTRSTALFCMLTLAATIVAATSAAAPQMVHRADAIKQTKYGVNQLNNSNLTVPMIIHGRVTNPGEWEGTVMVIGANGQCSDSGLCTGTMIHPEVVMTAGHCCDQGTCKLRYQITVYSDGGKCNVQAKQKQYAAGKTVLLQLSLLNQLTW